MVIDDYVCSVSVFVCRIFSVHLFLLPMFTCLLRAASITNSMRHCAAYIGLTVDGADAESANDARTERVRRSERSKGADCKSVGSAFEGSNPSPSTTKCYAVVFVVNFFGAFRLALRILGCSPI